MTEQAALFDEAPVRAPVTASPSFVPTWEVREGDSLALLRALPPASVDAIVTDPPYCSTGDAASIMRTSGGALSMPRESQFYESWLREHLREWLRVLKPDGIAWMTIDWRGASALDTACGRLGIHGPKVGVWDRGGLGMGYVMRSTYECFVALPMAEWKPFHRDVPDVWRVNWSPGNRTSGHSAEKPVALMRKAISTFTPPDSLILDPFTGSGTTGVACLRERRSFLGFEQDDRFAAMARERIADAQQKRETQPALFANEEP